MQGMMLLICLVSVGCDKDAVSSRSSTQSLSGDISKNPDEEAKGFKDTLFPLLQERCGSCHRPNGQAPSSFAQKNINAAYELAKERVDLRNPGNSIFVAKILGGHNCWSDCKENGAEIQDLIEKWSRKKPIEDDSGKISTESLSLSSISDSPIELRFDLSKLTGVSSAQFIILARKISNNGYSFSRPQIVTSETIFVKNIQAIVNEENTSKNTFEFISESIAAPGRVISEVGTTVSLEATSARDSLAISFAQLERTNGI